MDLKDILKGRNIPQEPPESLALKKYVQSKYNVATQVIISPHHLTLVVPSSALAGTLRLELPRMLEECKITQKLHIRIS
ncbi:MAG: hypothetical protein WCJ60_00115 [bacterium]|jgi:hypothetical protein